MHERCVELKDVDGLNGLVPHELRSFCLDLRGCTRLPPMLRNEFTVRGLQSVHQRGRGLRSIGRPLVNWRLTRVKSIPTCEGFVSGRNGERINK